MKRAINLGKRDCIDRHPWLAKQVLVLISFIGDIASAY
jgi:hypothetical protein